MQEKKQNGTSSVKFFEYLPNVNVDCSVAHSLLSYNKIFIENQLLFSNSGLECPHVCFVHFLPPVKESCYQWGMVSVTL